MTIKQTVLSAIAIIAIICGAALVASGYAEISKFGSMVGYATLVGGVLLIVVSYLYLRNQHNRSKG